MIEQIRIMNQNRFGRHTERLDQIEGQLSLFNEAECTADTDDDDPEDEETVIVKRKRKRTSAKRTSGIFQKNLIHIHLQMNSLTHFLVKDADAE